MIQFSISADHDFAGELDTREVLEVMDDLHRFGVRVLILSGGEPLLRPDIFEISRRAKALGFYVGLSSNGTLIDAALADRIAAERKAAREAERKAERIAAREAERAATKTGGQRGRVVYTERYVARNHH